MFLGDSENNFRMTIRKKEINTGNAVIIFVNIRDYILYYFIEEYWTIIYIYIYYRSIFVNIDVHSSIKKTNIKQMKLVKHKKEKKNIQALVNCTGFQDQV